MPAVSKKQQALMAIAKHNPDAVYPENRGVLDMSANQLGDFASTPTAKLPDTTAKVKGVPKSSKKNALLRKNLVSSLAKPRMEAV